MSKKEYIYATGKRKSSIARVNIIPGTGKITVNGKYMNEVYTLDTLKAIVLKPFKVVDKIIFLNYINLLKSYNLTWL